MNIEPKKIVTVDVNMPEGKILTGGVAFYRIDPHFRDFLKLCDDKHGIIGFEYTEGELNFGVILGNAK